MAVGTKDPSTRMAVASSMSVDEGCHSEDDGPLAEAARLLLRERFYRTAILE